MQRIKSFRAATASAIATLLILAAVPATAQAAQARGSGASGSQSVAKSSTTEEADSAHRAESEAADWVTGFARATTQLSVAYVDSYASAFVNPDQSSGWVAFTGAAPEEARALLAPISGVEIRENAIASERSMQEAAASIQADLTRQFSSSSFATYPDMTTSSIVIVTQDSTLIARGVNITQDVEQAAQASADSQKLPDSVTTRIVHVEGPVDSTKAQYGGRKITGGGYFCTGAFPVKRNGGVEIGVFTAAHCPGTGDYDLTANLFFTPVAYSIATATGPGGGDFRWNHSRDQFNGLTYVGPTGPDLRAFDSYANPVVGQTICNYGVSTSYKCSTVKACGISSQVTVLDNGQTYAVGGMCSVYGHVTAGGDSGGPWFLGRTALGIHHGVVGGDSVFSLVTNAMSLTRVSLLKTDGSVVP